jgi:hypothetical protein
VQSARSTSGPVELPALFWKKSLKRLSSLLVLQTLKLPGVMMCLMVHHNRAALLISEPSA